MLAAAQRLRRRGEFAATIRRGRRAGRGAVVVHLLVPPADQEPARIPPHGGVRAGFVVPRAVGVAVIRNRVKRRLRHLLRDRLAGLPPGTDLVVRALPGAADLAYSQLAADLDAALAAARTRKPVRR